MLTENPRKIKNTVIYNNKLYNFYQNIHVVYDFNSCLNIQLIR